MARLLIVVGVVLQDVIADAITTEVVDHVRSDGTPRPKADVERELGLVQVLGRLALWSGIPSLRGRPCRLACPDLELRDDLPARTWVPSEAK